VPFHIAGNIKNDQHFTSSTLISENDFLIGTYNNGFYHINKAGQAIEHFSKTEGLEDNNVKVIFKDKNQNIWLGLNNGIGFIAYNSAIKHINLRYLTAGVAMLSHFIKTTFISLPPMVFII